MTQYIKIVLVEVYRDETAPAEHKKTAHYQTWRDTVADMVGGGAAQQCQVQQRLPG